MNRFGRLWRLSAVASVVLAMVAAAGGCDPGAAEFGSYPASNRADCLPNVGLFDQNGARISLASLKGKLVLVDFIYTSCTGPCPMVTAKFRSIAKQLGGQLGSKVQIVSITLDPERDNPAQLAAYARAQGVTENGWLFLTGTPADIERVLDGFHLRREREPDGSLTHNISSFLIGPDGREIRQYNALEVAPQTVARDIERALERG